MARYHLHGSKFDGNNVIFTEQDKEQVRAFDNFKGFTVNGTLISNIFPEYTDAEFNNNNYAIPVNIHENEQQAEVWPVEKTFISSGMKRVIFFNPESCIPKIFYGLQPISALRCGIIYVYKLLFGQEDCQKIRRGLAAIPIKMYSPFQKYFKMVKEIWT